MILPLDIRIAGESARLGIVFNFLTETDIEKAERINHEYFAWTGKQPDAKEGVVSFLEKRKPEWKLKIPGDMPDFFPLTD